VDDQYDTMPAHVARNSERAGAKGSSGFARAVDKEAPAQQMRMLLQQVTDGAIAHVDLRDILPRVLESLCDAMRFDGAAILLLHDGGTQWNTFAAWGIDEGNASDARQLIEREVGGSIAANRWPLIVDTTASEQSENLEPPVAGYSVVGVPMLVAERVIGVIYFDSQRPRQLVQDELQTLQMFGSGVTLAMEHARLYEAERSARDNAKTMARQLKVLQAVSDVAMEHMRVSDLLQTLLQRVQEMFEVENVAILLPTPEGDALTLYTVRGPEEAVLGKVQVPMGQGVAGTIAATRRPLFVDNLRSVPVSNPFLREHFHSLLGVPLLSEGQLMGVIHIDSVRPRQFGNDELQLLEATAERIARALARARLFETTESSRDEAKRQITVLQEVAQRMDDFLGIASHELRTPLTSLTMNIQTLEHWFNLSTDRDSTPGEPEISGTHGSVAGGEETAQIISKARPVINRSVKSIRRLQRLVGELLDASRIRENRLEPELERVDLAQVVRNVVEEQRLAFPHRSVALDIDGGKPIQVQADPRRIGQVIANLIANALKYSPANRGVRVALRRERKQARVVVEDEGIGIAEQDLDHIWERFYQAKGPGHQTGSQIGLGLGLFIARNIVESHGGTVGVQSAPGKGSTFWFSLPQLTSRGST
jgi:signal transduction histidine kinase